MPDKTFRTPDKIEYHLEHEQLEKMMETVLDRAFIRIGLDPADPFENQQDFAFVRGLRQSVETIRRRGLTTAVSLVVTAILGALVMGVKSYFGK